MAKRIIVLSRLIICDIALQGCESQKSGERRVCSFIFSRHQTQICVLKLDATLSQNFLYNTEANASVVTFRS